MTSKGYLEIGDVLEDKRITDGDLFPNLLVHSVDVRLEHAHTLLGQGGRIIDRDVM